MRFRHYTNSGSLGATYLFGLNIYKSEIWFFVLDLIIGKHVFSFYGGRR